MDSATESAATIMACLADLGVETVPAHGIDGAVAGFELITEPGQEPDVAIASWQCRARFPNRPYPPFTPEQLGYPYDYFVAFRAPCLEEQGHQQEPAPTRAHFVEQWPNQGWWPRPSIEPLDSPDWDRSEELCPSVPLGLR